MFRTALALLLLAMTVLAIAVAACGASEEDEGGFGEESAAFGLSGPPGAPGLPGLPGNPARIAAMDAAAQEAASFPTPAPAPTALPMAMPAQAPAPAQPQAATKVQSAADVSSERPVASLVAQQRIIVRTVDMAIVVEDVTAAIGSATTIARDLGGWLVGSDHTLKHHGSVSIRVPAGSLDDAIDRLRELALEIDHEVTNSVDVTDEYVDLKSRMRNLEATETALLALFDRAQRVEDALDVQRELTHVQEQMEVIQGRIAYLEQTSAFSLVNVYLRLAPFDMRVDGGADQTVSVGEIARFRATFTPPEDIEDFVFTWDFGDGTEPVTGHRVAPSVDGDSKVTATVTHFYENERDSPFIATVELTGTGDAGVAEGSDTLIVSVTRIPNIEVFAGEPFSVTEGEEFEVSGSFTRPSGLTDVAYAWDFGDGSSPVTGEVRDGQTTASATHVYENHRPRPYDVTLTITATSEAGEIEAISRTSIYVEQALGWTVGGWSPGEDGKDAVRAMTSLLQGLSTLLIWLVIFSPVWLIAAAAIWFLVRRAKGYQSQRQPPENPPASAQD